MELVSPDWEDWDNSSAAFLAAWPFVKSALSAADAWTVSEVPLGNLENALYNSNVAMGERAAVVYGQNCQEAAALPKLDKKKLY